MSIRTSRWPAGVPCWTDLAAPDVEAAKEFYAAVLGWGYAATAAEFGGYAIAEVGGASTAGIGPAQEGAPPAWTLYFATDDAAKTEAAVAEAGGTVLLPTGEVGPLGRLFVAADPTGAVFGGWQAGTHIGAALVNEPGGLVWEDLRTPDPAAARAFYTAVFAVTTEDFPMAGPDYATFARPDEGAPLGGISGIAGNEEIGPNWLVYFAVADTDACVAATEAGSGTVIGPAFDSPFGRMALLADPAGARFVVLQNTTNQPTPDRAG